MSERSQTYIAIETEGDKTMSERTVFYENIHGRIYPRAILEDVQQGEYPSIVVLDKAGYRCGYVGVCSNSKGFESVKERLNDIESHGNTYCYFNENFDKVVSDPCEKKYYWVGYDCNHFYDGKDFDSVEKYFGKKMRDLQEGFEHDYYSYEASPALSLDDCRKINQAIIKQVSKLIKQETHEMSKKNTKFER